MSKEWDTEPMAGPTFPTFVYDGDCAFCSSCARFVERWIPTQARVEAWQLIDIEAFGLTVTECDAAVQWVTSPTAHTSGPVAIADLLKAGRPWWQALGALLGLRPVLWVAAPLYRWVARNRSRLPGGTATCALSQAERDQVR
jgi:predicted DCC family thiol-disulfide oxidoreductase YuxK